MNEPSEPSNTRLELDEIIDNLKLPLDKEKVFSFYEYISKYNPPEGFMQRVLSSIQYLDKNEWLAELELLKQEIEQVIGEEDYLAVIDEEDRSTEWTLKLLKEKGLRMPKRQFIDMSDPDTYPKRIKDGTNVISIDDWAISGATVIEFLIPSLKKSNIHLFLLHSTEYAREVIGKWFPNVQIHSIGSDIKLINEVLTPEDMNFLHEINDELAEELDLDEPNFILSANALFFSFYKTPDNFPQIMTCSRIGFIEETRFRPSL